MLTLTGCLPDNMPASIYDLCAHNVGQIQKGILSHKIGEAGVRNKFMPNAATPTDPTLKATWDALFTATDRTKPVETPFLAEPVSEAGAERTYGGGNATPNGVKIVIGREPQDFAAKILSQDQIAAIKPLKVFQQSNGIGVAKAAVYLVNSDGAFIMDSNGEANDSATLELYPIPITGYFVSDLSLGNLESVDSNMISWQFPPNWSDNLKVVTPSDFNGLDILRAA